MQFPFYIHLGSLAIPPHWFFETLAEVVGVRLFLWEKARTGDPIPSDGRWTVVAAAAVGALIGSRLVYWASDPGYMVENWPNPWVLLSGQSIVGALVGGLVAVELAKKRIGLVRSTGDLFAIPLAMGIAIGRIGCFLTGLDDHAYGLPATLPWAVDFGDGIPRHPTQLYEIVFLLPLAIALTVFARRPHQEGDIFRIFMAVYAAFRLGLEFLKPGNALAGLNGIQWVCCAVLVYYAWQVGVLRRQEVALSG